MAKQLTILSSNVTLQVHFNAVHPLDATPSDFKGDTLLDLDCCNTYRMDKPVRPVTYTWFSDHRPPTPAQLDMIYVSKHLFVPSEGVAQLVDMHSKGLPHRISVVKGFTDDHIWSTHLATSDALVMVCEEDTELLTLLVEQFKTRHWPLHDSAGQAVAPIAVVPALKHQPYGYLSRQLLRALRSGAVVVAEYVPGMEKYFYPGDQLLWYTHKDECVEAIRRYKDDYTYIARVRSNAHWWTRDWVPQAWLKRIMDKINVPSIP